MHQLEVKVWGPLACFTRPELHVERVSYRVPTPSAARGILEAIYWHPEFRWRVREIAVLEPIRWFTLMRNEVQRKASPGQPEPLDITAEGVRTQRYTVALRDVAYILRGEIVARNREEWEKHATIFTRRVARGQCYHRPALGCREFAADFAPPQFGDQPLAHSEDLGRMLFDIRYEREPPHIPLFYEAALDRGVVRVPQHLYPVREAGQ